MYTITVEKVFQAYHGLTYADGTVEDTHGHDWVVRVAISAQELDSNGLAIDFLELDRILQEITTPLEGKKLEETGFFNDVNASAEILAKFIYDSVEPHLPDGVVFDYTEVMEAPGCWAKYQR